MMMNADLAQLQNERQKMKPVDKKPSVVVVEPQCCGFEHAAVNAALLHTARLAYPSDPVIFYGEQSHLQYVRQAMSGLCEPDHISFKSIDVPRRVIFNRKRLLPDFFLGKKNLSDALRENAKILIFSSVTNTSILALKLLMRIKRFSIPTVAVVHGCLAEIVDEQSCKPMLSLKRVLALPHPKALQLIALGGSILNNLVETLPKQASRWSALDLGYLWPSSELNSNTSSPCPTKPISLGYVGVSHKGFDTFCQLANDVAPSPKIARFAMAGFYNGPPKEKPTCQYITDIPDAPLSREDFEDRVRQLTYIVWTAKKAQYRFTASGSFLDALAFCKPGIYLRNDYIEHCFERMGDIGYLCDTYEEVVSTVHNIINHFPSDRYQQQVENIRKGRAIFEPATLAPQLRCIAENIKENMRSH